MSPDRWGECSQASLLSFLIRHTHLLLIPFPTWGSQIKTSVGGRRKQGWEWLWGGMRSVEASGYFVLEEWGWDWCSRQRPPPSPPCLGRSTLLGQQGGGGARLDRPHSHGLNLNTASCWPTLHFCLPRGKQRSHLAESSARAPQKVCGKYSICLGTIQGNPCLYINSWKTFIVFASK